VNLPAADRLAILEVSTRTDEAARAGKEAALIGSCECDERVVSAVIP
jgi:hypothetical protein